MRLSMRRRPTRSKQPGKDFFRGLFTGADAVGDTDAMVGAAGESESREWLQGAFDALRRAPRGRHDIAALNRDGARYARKAACAVTPSRLASSSRTCSFHRRVVGIVNSSGCNAAADEGAQQE